MNKTLQSLRLWFLSFIFAIVFTFIGVGIHFNYVLNKSQDVELAYIKGQIDALNGVPVTHNPYSSLSNERHDAWLRGWRGQK